MNPDELFKASRGQKQATVTIFRAGCCFEPEPDADVSVETVINCLNNLILALSDVEVQQNREKKRQRG